MYMLVNMAQASLPGNRKLPDYMKSDWKWKLVFSISVTFECNSAAWVEYIPGFFAFY